MISDSKLDSFSKEVLRYTTNDDLNDKSLLSASLLSFGLISNYQPKNSPHDDVYALILQINTYRTIQIYFSTTKVLTRMWYNGDSYPSRWY